MLDLADVVSGPFSAAASESRANQASFSEGTKSKCAPSRRPAESRLRMNVLARLEGTNQHCGKVDCVRTSTKIMTDTSQLAQSIRARALVHLRDIASPHVAS